MRTKTTVTMMVILAIMLLMMGCSPNEIADAGDEEEIDIEIEGDIDYIDREVSPPVSKDLREQLLGASSIELKDTQNRTIGMLQDREEIASFINQIFEYDREEEYVVDQQVRVIGPMNFYFADDEAIFGLMNEAYIYVEGNYFLLDNRKAANIKRTFKSDVVTAPAGN
ncbi:MAG: hypothetical protein JJT76_19105 [Clostridiaceae bacterium]|nr:hypothetical protein [Clostridiaceae bacterium]